jgi:hypothetical protein
MRASSARMTFMFCNQYIAVVGGGGPATPEKREANV